MAAESLVWQESDTRALAGLAGWEDLETLAGLGNLEDVLAQENLQGLAYPENTEEMAFKKKELVPLEGLGSGELDCHKKQLNGNQLTRDSMTSGRQEQI